MYYIDSRRHLAGVKYKQGFTSSYTTDTLQKKKKHLQPQSRSKQGRTKLDMSERVLAILLRTPEDLSKNLPSNLGDIDRASPVLALRVLDVRVDINLGAKKARFD